MVCINLLASKPQEKYSAEKALSLKALIETRDHILEQLARSEDKIKELDKKNNPFQIKLGRLQLLHHHLLKIDKYTGDPYIGGQLKKYRNEFDSLADKSSPYCSAINKIEKRIKKLNKQLESNEAKIKKANEAIENEKSTASQSGTL